MSESFIEVQELVAHYGERLVLDRVSFSVQRNEIFVVIGGSGCGKTTLFKHMTGLLRPTSGRIIHAGSFKTLLEEPQSLTAKYLRGDLQIPLPAVRRKHAPLAIRVTGVRQHNLKRIDVEIPLNTLTCVTGVSGSGKSTLVHDVIYAAIKRAKGAWDKPVGAHDRLEGSELVTDVTLVDQAPIGRTPRYRIAIPVPSFFPISLSL